MKIIFEGQLCQILKGGRWIKIGFWKYIWLLINDYCTRVKLVRNLKDYNKKRELKTGDEIKLEYQPLPNRADAFKGYEGKVSEIYKDGSIILESYGSILVCPKAQNLKFEFLN